ncbi:MAG: metalloregulator ArsR/SmtB family transcription factor [Deinococcus sp.]|nr:metalloregulator ArsR/SmtB family transcription factor [Deinococcus sp.]
MNEKLTTKRLKALADPTRLKIVRIMAELPDDHVGFDPRCGTAYGVCFCHLEERLGLSKPTVSHHLRVLREAGVIEAVRVGRWTYYRLLAASIEGIIADMAYLRPSQKFVRLEFPAS